ncbi:MAG: hypothetical protein NVS1B4_11170 [Gemmatimonadaceae bacterium]
MVDTIVVRRELGLARYSSPAPTDLAAADLLPLEGRARRVGGRAAARALTVVDAVVRARGDHAGRAADSAGCAEGGDLEIPAAERVPSDDAPGVSLAGPRMRVAAG